MALIVNGTNTTAGASLPTTPASALLDAANAGTIVGLAQGTGAGTSFDPDVVVEAGVGIAAGTTAGATLVGDGTEGAVLTSATISALLATTTLPAAQSALGIPAVTTLYASDFTAVAGSESASISGTGANSTFTIGASGTAREYGSGGITAARIIAALPSGWRTMEVEVQITSVTGTSTSGWRFLTVAIQPQGSGVPTSLWGTSWPDTTSVYFGARIGGGNAGGQFGTGLSALAADRWLRMTMDRTEPFLAALVGSGSAGARPTSWRSTNDTPPAVTGSPGIIDVGQSSWLVLAVQSYGLGGANTYTGKITVRCTQ